jgi:hypothetical protein
MCYPGAGRWLLLANEPRGDRWTVGRGVKAVRQKAAGRPR